MKRILFYILSLLIVSAPCYSCDSSDDNTVLQIPDPNPDPNPNPSPTLVAKWKKVGLTDMQGSDIAYHDHECSTIYDYLEFFSNGTATDVEYLSDCTTTIEDSGTYTVNGDTLTIEGNDPDGNLATGDMTILELTNNSLKLKVEPLDFVILYEAY